MQKHEAMLNQSITNLLRQEDEVEVCFKVPYHVGDGCVLVADEIRFSFALPQIMDSKAILVSGWFLRYFLFFSLRVDDEQLSCQGSTVFISKGTLSLKVAVKCMPPDWCVGFVVSLNLTQFADSKILMEKV